ncbi:unnamed protein product [Schistocephalus solidus]|uniref:Uncharacterized protein n=1 Tax=Schistocephalus solidus TaxID=70667 RepID=A0A183TPY7_SCHSO|nr:unnamed protein product [Schistocephalus solidus]
MYGGFKRRRDPDFQALLTIHFFQWNASQTVNRTVRRIAFPDSRSLNDEPKFEIICKHGNIAVQFVCPIVDVDNEQNGAENRALKNTTLNLNLGRLFVADMDSF